MKAAMFGTPGTGSVRPFVFRQLVSGPQQLIDAPRIVFEVPRGRVERRGLPRRARSLAPPRRVEQRAAGLVMR
ncbi:hypothetical protein GCM10017771_59790 [Streptomyces capitiformicae]|uniref:Uncharacterized protein n=1 Tax=Streptomyces capitiformicae TaxID=2014920 RepID=A0A919DF73_9ACTN|nr:hypothetical protein GCM10017771_59790 [Streptomyces capitiformicae]